MPMEDLMRKIFSLLLLLGLAGPALADDMDAAQTALDAQDYATALRLFKKVANRNFIEGQYRLGVMYRDGLGVERDPATALKWFEESGGTDWMREVGKFGYPEAQYQAGLMYRDGIGTERDLEEAADWFEKAAKHDYPPAQLELAAMLLRGDGVDQDRRAAYIWASLAAESLSDAEQEAAVAIRDEAAKHLGPDQLAEAKLAIEQRAD